MSYRPFNASFPKLASFSKTRRYVVINPSSHFFNNAVSGVFPKYIFPTAVTGNTSSSYNKTSNHKKKWVSHGYNPNNLC